MTRVVYLFTSLGSASHDQVAWSAKDKSNNASALSMKTEGFTYMWNKLIENKVVDEVLSVVESNRGPGSIFLGKNHTCLVIPHINQLKPLLRDNDIIVARGGFRPWPPLLKEMNDTGHWVLFYRAASNRAGWPYWDIVLDDLIDHHLCEVGQPRLHFQFNKPVPPELFFYRPEVPKKYDILINASHIHDKKGQWRAINAAIAYQKAFKENLSICLPGGWYKGTETNQIQKRIKDYGLNVAIPGMVSRLELSKLFAQSKLYIHLGGAGQNDRGALEAMACGVPVILANTQFHAPFLYKDPKFSALVKDPNNFRDVAETIRKCLKGWWHPQRASDTADYYRWANGVYEVVLPQMTKLLEYCMTHPVNRAKIMEMYGL